MQRHVGRLDQVAGIRLLTLGDAGARGVRVLEFRTGTGFTFDVLVDRAFDIGRCELRGIPLAWQSAVGVEGPWYYEPEGLGFFRGFGGGLLTTCGIDHTLFMAEDTAAQYHYPPKQTETFGLHGRVSNRPRASRATASAGTATRARSGPRARHSRRASSASSSCSAAASRPWSASRACTIHDVVENVGHDLTPHMLLYHVNAGFPVVDEGLGVARHGRPASLPAATIRWRATARWPLRRPDSSSRCSSTTSSPTTDGASSAAIVNRRLGVGVYEVFRQEQLPHHFVWRMLGEGTYVVGIEPCTNRTAGRLDARERGELIELGAGESRSYDLELGALDGASRDRCVRGERRGRDRIMGHPSAP